MGEQYSIVVVLVQNGTKEKKKTNQRTFFVIFGLKFWVEWHCFAVSVEMSA